MGGSFREFQIMTLREVFECIEAYRAAEVVTFRRAHNLAVISGQISNMPHMSKADQRKLMEAVQWDDEATAKEYTDEEVQSLLDGVKEIYGTEATIKKKDGQIISRT